MISKDDFIRVIRDELRLPLIESEVDFDFDQVVNWGSVHLVRLVVALERKTGRRISVRRLLDERTPRGMYALLATD